jgi:hypothetical protein
MKFVNYGIPFGLSVKETNSQAKNSNIYSNFNGITDEGLTSTKTSATKMFKKNLKEMQSGGSYNTEPCETVFHIFDYPIKFGDAEHEMSNVELTEDEELSEEDELNSVSDVESEDKEEIGEEIVEEIGGDSRHDDVIGDLNDGDKQGNPTSKPSSNKSTMNHSLRDLIDDMVSNKTNEILDEPNNNDNPKKIRSLRGLFSQNSQNDDIETDFESRDTLESILRALGSSKKTTR